MYEEYFGLKRPPFKISPDTSLFFEGGNRGDILGALVYAIHRGEGIVKVVGEVGSGKTMLCRMLQLKLPKSVEIIYIGNPSVSAQDILFVIAHELELPAAKDASKHEVMHMLQDYLLQRHIENKQVVLFIEEAQGMPLDTLEEIRLLSNLETDQHKLLQIILFGQPELDENLSKKSIRQLRERITHNFDLAPLTANEIYKYLNFRMREVGYAGPELITSSLANKVAQYSGGLVRRINIIADKILLSAYAESTHNLTTRHVVAAVNDSAFGEGEVRKNSNIMWWLALSILIALALAIYKSEPLWATALVKFGAEPADLVQKQPTEVAKPAKLVRPVTESGDNREDTGVLVTEPVIEETVILVETEAVETEAVETEMNTATAKSKSEQGNPEQYIEALDDTSGEASEKANSQLAPVEIEVVENEQKYDAKQPVNDTTPKYNRWLSVKLQQSKEWLSNAKKDNVSIQVLMSRKSKERELVYYLQNEWPLSLDKTYLYEVNVDSQLIYRVFYSEFKSVAQGRNEIQRLPESVKVNSPYLHSVYRMQKALL
jgi:MSHA biogenesis protein MshM